MGRPLTKTETDIVNTDLEIEVLLKMVDIKRDHMVRLHRRLYAEMEPKEDEPGDIPDEEPPVPPKPDPVLDARETQEGFWGVGQLGNGFTDYKDTIFRHTGEGSCISSKNGTEPIKGVSFKNCRIEGTGHNYWGMRVYDIDGMTIEDCEFRNLGHYLPTTYNGKPAGKWEGHGAYINLWGDLTIAETLFKNLLGNGVQLVWRENHETQLPDKERRGQGVIDIQDSHFEDNAKHEDRGSYSISIFNPGQEVYIQGVSVETTDNFPLWVDKYGVERGSRGALCVVRGQTWDSQTPKVTLQDFTASLLKNRQGPAIKLQNVLEVDWIRGRLEDRGGAPVRIDIFPDCPKGQIKNVDGNYEIYRVDQNGKNGTLVAKNRDYEWAT